jgi:hypothetical protein
MLTVPNCTYVTVINSCITTLEGHFEITMKLKLHTMNLISFSRLQCEIPVSTVLSNNRYKEHIGGIKYNRDTTNNAKQEMEIIQIQANGPLLDIQDKNKIYKQYKNGNTVNAQKIITPSILFDLVIERENHRDYTCDWKTNQIWI